MIRSIKRVDIPLKWHMNERECRMCVVKHFRLLEVLSTGDTFVEMCNERISESERQGINLKLKKVG